MKSVLEVMQMAGRVGRVIATADPLAKAISATVSAGQVQVSLSATAPPEQIEEAVRRAFPEEFVYIEKSKFAPGGCRLIVGRVFS